MKNTNSKPYGHNMGSISNNELLSIKLGHIKEIYMQETKRRLFIKLGINKTSFHLIPSPKLVHKEMDPNPFIRCGIITQLHSHSSLYV